MEEVRSYWQVASISHFCSIFNQQFRLPTFEPEELEQAFILEIPAPPPKPTLPNNNHNNINHNNHTVDSNCSPDVQSDQNNHNQDDSDDPEWVAPKLPPQLHPPPPPSQTSTNQTDDQHLHLLVKLAVALLKPHFNSKIRYIRSSALELVHFSIFTLY